MIQTVEMLCAGCMQMRADGGKCSNCNWEVDENEVPWGALRSHVVVGERFVVGRVLGRGGFGITYLGFDLVAGERVAIKEYFPAHATRTANGLTVTVSTSQRHAYAYGLERFAEEGKNLLRFRDHPSIVEMRDFVEANDTAYLVMAFVDGITLKQYLDQSEGRISFEVAARIVGRVLDALRAVHEAKLLHRDVSPENIYLTADKRVKLLDFGAARYAMSEHSQTLDAVLRPGYAPEEQYRVKGRQGPWTDVYAVAATIYRCICGEPPPPGVDRLAQDEIVPPSQMGASLTEEQEEVLLKALAVKAIDRYQSVLEFQSAIDACLENKREQDPPPPPPPAPASTTAWKWGCAVTAGVALMLGVSTAQMNQLVKDLEAKNENLRVSLDNQAREVTAAQSNLSGLVPQNPLVVVSSELGNFGANGARLDGPHPSHDVPGHAHGGHFHAATLRYLGVDVKGLDLAAATSRAPLVARLGGVGPGGPGPGLLVRYVNPDGSVIRTVGGNAVQSGFTALRQAAAEAAMSGDRPLPAGSSWRLVYSLGRENENSFSSGGNRVEVWSSDGKHLLVERTFWVY